MGDKYDQLEKLKRLRDEGVLTGEEYAAEKNRVLSLTTAAGGTRRFWGMEERVFCMLLHLSQLLGVILPFIPFVGVIVPVVMWASEKDKSRAVDIHGRNVLNWIISYIIYFAVSLVLIAILIGGLLLVAVITLNIVFAIIGGVKANNGEYWKYPLSIPFFKVPEPEPEPDEHAGSAGAPVPAEKAKPESTSASPEDSSRKTEPSDPDSGRSDDH